MRISELVYSDHVLKACNILVADNKDKILIMLYTSKTHGLESKPQKIKIVSNNTERSGHYKDKNFCPFKVVKQYMQIRDDGFANEEEPFFVFSNYCYLIALGSGKALRFMRQLSGNGTLSEQHVVCGSLRYGTPHMS